MEAVTVEAVGVVAAGAATEPSRNKPWQTTLITQTALNSYQINSCQRFQINP